MQSEIKAHRKQQADRILAQLQHTISPVLARYPIEAAYVYGSVARGTMLPSSDVDIALLLSVPMPPYEQLMLELVVQGEVEAACDVSPVDVRAINRAPLLVRGRIVQEGVLVYERDRKCRVAFEVQTRKQYFDFAPAFRRMRDSFLRRVHKEGLLHG